MSFQRSECTSRCWVLLILGLQAAGLAACGSSDSTAAGPAAPTATTVQASTTLNLYGSATSGNRLFVMVTAVGAASASLPLIFDTGSAGVALYAPSIFPPSMVSSSGFVFPAGQTSMTYQGITITDQQMTRDYGLGDTQRTQHGNLGFATLTFGDSQGTLTSASMPILFYYSVTRTATGEPITGQPQQGIFGVNDATNLITMAGSSAASATSVCSPSTAASCHMISAFKYLTYASGIDAGFMLSPTALQPCDITTAGSCAGKPVLTVGLTAALESGFSTVNLTCPPPDYSGPAAANGYPLCQQAVPGSTITLSGTEMGTLSASVLFDTGTPDMELAVPSGSSFPASVPLGTDVLLLLPSGFTYSYTADAGTRATTLLLDTTGRSAIGIDYFTTHSYFVDFTTSTTGWK